MKFLHTSDLHLGITLCEKSFIEYQQELTEIICSAVKSSFADAVIIAGDIFDNALSNADAISVYNKIVTELCLSMNKKVIICAGNHDGASRLSSCNELLKECGLYIYGRISFPINPLEFEGCNVYVLPYFNIEEVRSAYPDSGIKSYADAMNVIICEIRKTLDRNKVNILCAHCFVVGGELSDSDTAAKMGGTSAVPASVFEGFDYVALGHLHKPQTIGKNIRYSGTPMKYSFSEEKHKKSFTVFDTDTKSFEEIFCRQPIELRVIKDSFEKLLSFAKTDENRNDFVKIIMTDRFFGQDTFSQLKAFYPNLLQLEGKQFENSSNSDLTLKDIESLSPLELVKKFYEEQTGEEILKEQIDWFLSAVTETEEGGGLE